MDKTVHQYVENQYRENFGDPEFSMRMQGGDDPRFPEVLDLYFWKPTEENELTTIATNGISQLPFHGKDHRCELHMYIAGELNESEIQPLTEFIANFSINPFVANDHFEEFQSFGLTGAIPSFPSCSALYLSGPFTEEGWDVMMYQEFPIHIYNMVPLTRDEHTILTANPESGPEKLITHFQSNDVRIFERR